MPVRIIDDWWLPNHGENWCSDWIWKDWPFFGLHFHRFEFLNDSSFNSLFNYYIRTELLFRQNCKTREPWIWHQLCTSSHCSFVIQRWLFYVPIKCLACLLVSLTHKSQFYWFTLRFVFYLLNLGRHIRRLHFVILHFIHYYYPIFILFFKSISFRHFDDYISEFVLFFSETNWLKWENSI